MRVIACPWFLRRPQRGLPCLARLSYRRCQSTKGQSLPVTWLAPPPPSFQTERGSCRPFGAIQHKGGVNFAIFSRHAQAVSLVLFREGREEPIAEIPLDSRLNKTGDVWHIFVHGLSPNILYGYRVNGPTAPKTVIASTPRRSCWTLMLGPSAAVTAGAMPMPRTATTRPADPPQPDRRR